MSVQGRRGYRFLVEETAEPLVGNLCQQRHHVHHGQRQVCLRQQTVVVRLVVDGIL